MSPALLTLAARKLKAQTGLNTSSTLFALQESVLAESGRVTPWSMR